MENLKPCPGCGSESVRIVRKKGKFKCECDGDCWTETKWCWTVDEAITRWNSIADTAEELPEQMPGIEGRTEDAIREIRELLAEVEHRMEDTIEELQAQLMFANDAARKIAEKVKAKEKNNG